LRRSRAVSYLTRFERHRETNVRERFRERSLFRERFPVFPRRRTIVRRATMEDLSVGGGEGGEINPGVRLSAVEAARVAASSRTMAGAGAGHRASFATAALSLRDAPLLLLA